MKRYLTLLVFFLCLSAFAFPPERANADAPKEYYVKAAILYKFIQFIEWPDKSAPVNICIMGADPFGAALGLLEKQAASNSQLHIYRNVGDDAASRCSILFISRSEDYRLSQVLQSVAGRPVLTVGESDNFIKRGGMVGFVTTNKVNFEINNAAVRKANLRIDARVLELALNVIDR